MQSRFPSSEQPVRTLQEVSPPVNMDHSRASLCSVWALFKSADEEVFFVFLLNRNFQGTSDFAQGFHILARAEGKLNQSADILAHLKSAIIIDGSVSRVGNVVLKMLR